MMILEDELRGTIIQSEAVTEKQNVNYSLVEINQANTVDEFAKSLINSYSKKNISQRSSMI